MTQISGEVASGFEPVAEAFEASFTRPEMGAALCIYLHGTKVVDLWGGTADARTGAAWSPETLNIIFSCTKGLMSLLVAQLVEEGLLDYQAPVSRYWPEFAASGKTSITVAQAISHRAGLSAPRIDLHRADIVDWQKMAAYLAAENPLWPPGSGYAYHALTHGWLTGELVRRVTGLSAGEAFVQRIATPLNAEAWIGLPAQYRARVAHLLAGATHGAPAGPPPAKDSDAYWLERATTLGDALPPALITPDGGFNDPSLWSAEIPGAGGISSADALARIWSAAVVETGGVRLLAPETVAAATKVQSEGAPVFAVPAPWPRFGMGFLLDCDTRRLLTPNGFGHDGAGGQVAFAEPGIGLGFAYLTNLLEGAGDGRANGVVDALRGLPQIAAAPNVHPRRPAT